MSFMKKVLGIGGGDSGGGSSNEPFNAMMANPKIAEALTNLNTMIGKQSGAFDTLLGNTNKNFGAATDFYQGLLSGDPAKRRSLFAGTLNDISTATQGAQRALLANPNVQRGGAMSLGLSNLERAGFGEKARAMTGVEDKAAQALAGIAGQQGQLSAAFSGQAGTGSGDLFRNLMGGYSTQQELEIQRQKLAFEKSKALGSGIGNLLKWLLPGGVGDLSNIWKKIFGGSGDGSDISSLYGSAPGGSSLFGEDGGAYIPGDAWGNYDLPGPRGYSYDFGIPRPGYSLSPVDENGFWTIVRPPPSGGKP